MIIDGSTRAGEGEAKISTSIRASQYTETRCIISSDVDSVLRALLCPKPKCYLYDFYNPTEQRLICVDTLRRRLGDSLHDLVLLALMDDKQTAPVSVLHSSIGITLPQCHRNPIRLTNPSNRTIDLLNFRQFARNLIQESKVYRLSEAAYSSKTNTYSDPQQRRQLTLHYLRHLRWYMDLYITGNDVNALRFPSKPLKRLQISFTDIANISDTDIQDFQAVLDADGRQRVPPRTEPFSAAISLLTLFKGITRKEILEKYIPSTLLPLHAAYQNGAVTLDNLPEELSRITTWTEHDLWCVQHRPLRLIGNGVRDGCLPDDTTVSQHVNSSWCLPMLETADYLTEASADWHQSLPCQRPNPPR